MKSVQLINFLVFFTSILLIGFLGCNEGSSSSGDNNTNNKDDDNATEQISIYNDYKTLSDFTKATYLAKLRFMSVMSNGFKAPYGEVEPEAEYVAAYVDSHTHVLESLDNATAAVERINAAKKEPGADFAPTVPIQSVMMASEDYSDGKTEDSFLSSAWDLLVSGLGGSASRSRERITNTLDQLSKEGKREAYEYARTARGIMNRDDVEDNAEDFWESLKQGKYDNQCAVLYNDLTTAADIEFADVAQRGSTSGKPAVEAALKDGSALTKSARNVIPSVDGNVLGDEIGNLVEKNMDKELEKFQEHTEEHHYGYTDNAVESFADSVGNAAWSGAIDPDHIKDLSDSMKKAVDANVPADDYETPLDQGILTVNDDNEQTDGSNIVMAEGEDTEGNPSVYISARTWGDMTMILPEGFWEVTAAGANSVIDSISAEVQAGLETLATVDTSEAGDDGNGDDEDDPANGDDEQEPTDPVMEISTTVLDEDVDYITYRVAARILGVTGPTNVTLSLQNAQTWDDTTKSLSADGTVTWSVTVLENNGVITVKRSDTNESQSFTLQGTMITYDGTYSGTARTTYEGEDCWCWDTTTLTVTVNGSSLSGDVTGTVNGNRISGHDNEYPEIIFSGTINGNVMSGTWYESADLCCSGTFYLTN